MRLAVRLDGTLNYHYDTDSGWAIECSIPWKSLQETCTTSEKLNKPGSVMRVQFSRVQKVIPDEWPIEDWRPIEGVDWLWTPMLAYQAHVTELYGRVILSGKTVLQSKDWDLENMFPFKEPPPAPKKTKPGSMVKIKGGNYTIGPDYADISGASPQGEVTIDDFYIDRYEVTIGEYVKFLNAGGHDEY